MSQKNSLDRYLEQNKEYKDLIIRVKDVCNNLNFFRVLFFVNVFEYNIIKGIVNHYDNVKCLKLSKIENAEYYLVIITNKDDNNCYDDELSLLKFNYNNKFNTLNHKDILGSIMAMQVKRENIGDIVIKDCYVYFEVKTSLVQYFIDNLKRIKNIDVNLEISNDNVVKEINCLKYSGIIKSLRLDNVVKEITKLSNREVRELILAQKVKLNYLECSNFSKKCANNDLLSIRKYGRFLLKIDESRKTKRDNYIIDYYKYL